MVFFSTNNLQYDHRCPFVLTKPQLLSITGLGCYLDELPGGRGDRQGSLGIIEGQGRQCEINIYNV